MNNPKQYPKNAMLSKAEEMPTNKVMSDKEMAAQMRKNFILARGVDKSRSKQQDGTNS